MAMIRAERAQLAIWPAEAIRLGITVGPALQRALLRVDARSTTRHAGNGSSVA